MIARSDLAALTPAQRAQVIYVEAQSQLSNRLWRAALGDSDRNDSKSNVPFGSTGMAADSLMQLLGAQMPVVANRACACACRCACRCGGDSRSEPSDGDLLDEAKPAGVDTILEQGTALAARALPGHRPPQDSLDQPAQGGAGGLALGANGRYAQLLAAAEARSGVPAPALAAIVDAEAAKTSDGSWNPLSRNPRSSAAGLGQFLSGTWQDLARTPGTWLNEAARERGWLDASGQVDPAWRSALLALRYDPAASILSVADLAKSNLLRLEQSGLNVRADSETTAKAAYLSHHLGLGDARKFLAGAIDPARARTLLATQIGNADAEARISSAGDAVLAHRQWLLGFIGQHIKPEKFSS